MRRKIFMLGFLLFLGISSHAQTVPATTKNPVEEKTNAVVTRLNIDNEEKKRTVSNIFTQTDKRITDLELGTPDYTKLINYINQERKDMLKVALSADEFTAYQKYFSAKDDNEITDYIKQNNTFLTKKAAADLKEKKDNDKIMLADKTKLAKEEAKEKVAAKKAAEKQKVADKKAAEKQKAADKKEKEKQKAADKKEKERAKKEADKLKEAEKKNAAKQKALEKKQKELDKKLNKK
jgi:hypothetical protein